MKEKEILRKELFNLNADIKEFSASLTPGNYHFIGIRIPTLKNFAKNYPNKLNILKDPYFYYQEEILIYIYILNNIKLDNKEYLKYLNKWINFKNHSWYTSDSGIKSCKFIKQNQKFFFNYFINLLKTNDTYKLRIAIVSLFTHFKNETYINEILNNLIKINSNEYYVNMALAWCYQDIYSFYNKDLIINLILKTGLNNDIVLNLTKKKILESKKTTIQEKQMIKEIKKSHNYL